MSETLRLMTSVPMRGANKLPATFCIPCTSWTKVLGGPFIGDHYTHHLSFEALEASSQSCPLCKLIHMRFEETGQVESIKEESMTGYPTVIQFVGRNKENPPLNNQKDAYWKDLTSIIVYCGAEGYNDDWYCELGLFAERHDLAATSGVIAGRTVHNYSGSDQSLGIIQEWLSQCAKTHVDCLPDTALAFPETVAMSISWRTQLPTRVIHVGTDSGNSPPFLHIPSIGEVGTYVTLSHCWGNSQPFTTTHATLFDRMSSIDINGLPKSFRDAITITRKIGIAYLWIDSLCIIQNDTRDWERESAKMAEVYGNSYVTLAATASPDGSKGMLFARDTKTKAVLQYPATNSSGSASDSSDLASIIIMPAVMSLIDPLRRSPLNSRGWVVQERILSKRIIHFNSDQIFWDCQQKFLSEDGRYNETISSGRYSRRNLNPKLLTSHGPDSKPTQQTHKSDDSIIAYWLAIVTEFSQKQLTVHADVFPALAGIASLVQKRLGDEYIAGMWRSDLHFELLWTASEAPMRQAKEWRAPSWSWAANIGGISYEYSHSLNEYTNSMTIVSVHTEWSARPMSSTLRHGYLVVEGILEEVSFNPESTMNHFYDTETFYLLPKGNDPDTKDGYNYSWAIFDFEPPSREITIYCLRVCTVDGGQENRVLLLQATRRKENEFRRIGSGRIDKKPGTFGNGQMTLVSII